MPNHVFIDINRSELFSVVNHYSMPNHIWEDCTSSGPSLERFLLIFGVQLGDLFHKMIVDERTFFYTSSH
ncbi:conserved hypothetical protein [Leptospira interrogans serovar Manilae]|uniref:Uncharacterized protein n=1 Tax=Leptospira interrogans serovar Manilae TaxID=214675 RepID=A0AAQ1NWJ6_LEPIR|nr:conserved hypothetical protein [Leptospira interrogans serovar Manilae]